MLTSQQRKKLRDALISAFPERSLLERLLYFELEKNLNEIAGDSDLQTVVYQLIQKAEAQGWLVDLVRAAHKENPGNSELAAITFELLPPETSSVPLLESSSSETATKPRTQQRKISVSGAAVVIVFVLVAGGTTLSIFHFIPKEDPSMKQPSHKPSPEKGLDYTKLEDSLKIGQWHLADYETELMILRAVGSNKDDFEAKKLLNLPCEDLEKIDRLWVEYSNGHFGFSVQKEIYLKVGGLPDRKYHQQAWEKFGDLVGWREKGRWITKDKARFNTKAPPGHLPGGVALNGGPWEGWNGWSLWSRLNDCPNSHQSTKKN